MNCTGFRNFFLWYSDYSAIEEDKTRQANLIYCNMNDTVSLWYLCGKRDVLVLKFGVLYSIDAGHRDSWHYVPGFAFRIRWV